MRSRPHRGERPGRGPARRPSPAVRRRRAAVGGLAFLLIVGAAVVVSLALAAGGHSGQSRAGDSRPSPRALTAVVPSRSGDGTPAVIRESPGHADAQLAGAGSLPQTSAYPSGTSAQFRHLMRHLWDGVVRDSLDTAVPAFFPLAAYVRLKQIGSAASDWSLRLLHDYRLDIEAAHSLLGRHPAEATLVRIEVPAGYGHWVSPGVCYNSIGYYEVANARVVYRAGGAIHSFGIASLISWRGVWYVVHLGAILRSGEGGVVDEPALGPGESRPSGTC